MPSPAFCALAFSHHQVTRASARYSSCISLWRCQPVWDELLAQGAAIRQEPLASEAWAVAQETMRRVRHNIERLIPRLRALGYRFGEIPPNEYYDHEEWEREFTKAYPIFQPPPPETARVLDGLEQRMGVLPLSIRAFYLEIGGVNFIGT